MMARDIPNPAGQAGATSLEGPPWIRTTRGYFLAHSIFAGDSSHPWILNPSLAHSRLSALPHVADNAELSFVSWRHPPIGPTQISGGVSKVLRSAAPTLPSFERAKSGKLPKAWRASAPFQIVRTELSAGVNSEIAPPPPTISVKRMRSGVIQKSELTELFRSRVRFVSSRPSAEIVKRSPP